MPRFAFVVVMLWTAVVLLAPGRASARQVSFGSGAQAVQSLSVGYYLIDFEFNGDERPLFVFDFDQPAFGLVYSRPHFLFTFALGDQRADRQISSGHEALRLLDVSFTTWGELSLAGRSAGQSRVYIPIALFSNYRRVSAQSSATSQLEAFNVTVLGLGAGLALESVLGKTVLFEARAYPILGFATSSFTNAIGSAYLIDADAQLHLVQLFGAVGLSLGYSFRYQVWNVNASNFLPDVADALFDYKGRHHLFRVGLNW